MINPVLGTPRATAANTNGCWNASDNDCDCSRSHVAASGNASARTGSGRCHARSDSHASQDISLAFTEDMPPTGSHPVRAATTASSSEARSGGIEIETNDTILTSPETVSWRVPVTTPQES